jgi:hypothetical protein
MRWLVMLGVLLAAGCGDRSMLGPELDKNLTSVDTAIQRGDVELACSRLKDVTGPFELWAEGARGERASTSRALVKRLAELEAACAPPPAGDPAKVSAAWPPIHAEMRKISVYETSWLTIFTYVSMLAVGIGAYALLRRMKRS